MLTSSSKREAGSISHKVEIEVVARSPFLCALGWQLNAFGWQWRSKKPTLGEFEVSRIQAQFNEHQVSNPIRVH
jgi:hypothetical protein